MAYEKIITKELIKYAFQNQFLVSKIKFRIRLDQLIQYMFKITGYFHSLIGSKGI